MILIGSKAIKHWFPDFPREPKDTDYAVLEVPKWTPELAGRVEYLINPIIGGLRGVANPDVLYTLKMSHTVGWKLENGSWDKHVWDIQWLKNKGCTLNRPLFDKLYRYWETIHGPNKRSDLDMSAEDFFDNAVGFPIPHDDLHEMLITHPYFEGQKEPTYKKILIGEVDVSMEKFNNLNEKEKINVVIEEVMVMATERFKDLDYPFAHHRMLKKFIREHAKMDEAIWILENWPKVVKAPFNFKQYLNEQIKKHGEYNPV